MRDNLKVVFFSRQTLLKQHCLHRKEKLRNLQITAYIMMRSLWIHSWWWKNSGVH